MGDVRAVLHLLASAERPVILAGAGVLRARCSNDLVRFAELLHVPVVAAWRRGDVIPNDHPLYLGMSGYGSSVFTRDRIRTADALLVIGSRLGEVTTGGYAIPAPGQRWIHVDLEPRDGAVGDSPAPERAIRSDARAFLRAAVARLKDGVLLAAPVAARDGHNGADRAAWEAATEVDVAPWDGPGVHPGRVIAELRRLLPDDAILTTDAGAFGGWAARGFRFRRPGTFLGPTSGAMGYGFPAALAASLVHRERRVVALLGRRRDGDDARGGRDGRARGGARHRDRVRQRAVRDDPRPPGRGRGARRRPGRTSGRSTSPPRRGPAAPGVCASTPMPGSSPPCGPRLRRRARR